MSSFASRSSTSFSFLFLLLKQVFIRSFAHLLAQFLTCFVHQTSPLPLDTNTRTSFFRQTREKEKEWKEKKRKLSTLGRQQKQLTLNFTKLALCLYRPKGRLFRFFLSLILLPPPPFLPHSASYSLILILILILLLFRSIKPPIHQLVVAVACWMLSLLDRKLLPPPPPFS